MKVIALHKNEQQLISEAIANNRQAQQQLYSKYASKMLSVCRQYIKDIQFAEDVMITGFMKMFTNLKKFEHKGSFEGWVKRIMIHECIDYLRVKKNNFNHKDIDDVIYSEEEDNYEMEGDFSIDDIQLLIDNLPEGYKMVFNLYIIDGYKHNEIAELLNISEGTSKSQLSHAKRQLQTQITELKNKSNEIASINR
jgi:RNA polymerase sigma-70 factor (ECF subfamily)